MRPVPTGPPARHRRSASLTNWAEEDRIRCPELTGKDDTMNDARTIDAHTNQLAPRLITPEALVEIEHRVLWLATSMIHHANRVRPNPTGLKVGGHQASCASM
ncbi:pyruvate dehydrogenase, partial [Rhodococcus sp. T2V]|nr:pyruvate dehydrogenase [Rhodococcus sp. T2V]